MKAWTLLLLWLALGVLFGATLWPLMGTSRAILVPVGWCVGGILGGLGGAVFTITSRRQELRLRRTLSASMGAVILAVLAGAAPGIEPGLEMHTVWAIAIAFTGAVVIAPLCVIVSFWINDLL